MKAVLLIATALFSMSCMVEDIVFATDERHADAAPPVDEGDHPLPGCATNDDCEVDEFCSKSTCQDQRGNCSRWPIICGARADPTCGCDGITYFNDCLRRSHGIAASTQGQCDNDAVVCGGAANLACPGESRCAQFIRGGPLPRCPTDLPGICWVIPDNCDPSTSNNQWMPCGPPAPCVDTCTAIQAGVPHSRASCQ